MYDYNLGNVAIIILTLNSISKLGNFFDKVLKSISMQTYPKLRVIIVDNGSKDGTPEYAAEKLKKLQVDYTVLKLGKNYGWSGGNNRGAIYVKEWANYIFFINDDIILEPDCVEKLVKLLAKDRKIAAVQPLIINKDRSKVYGFDIGLSGFPGTPRDMLSPFYVSGAALLTRADVFFLIGMFDEDLFLYHDDLDYGWRLRNTGYKVICMPDAKAFHWGSATLGQGNPKILYFVIRNNIWVLAKNASLLLFFIGIFLSVLEILVSFLGNQLLIKKDPKGAFIILKGIIHGLKGLNKGLKKRNLATYLKKIRNRNTINLTNSLVDMQYLFPRRLRKLLGLKW